MTSAESTIPVDVAAGLSAADLGAVLDLVAAVTDGDGIKPFSDQALLHLRAGPESTLLHLLARRAGRLAGYALVDTSDPSATGVELAVPPAARQVGVATALVQKLLEVAPDARLRLWAHGDPPAGARLAEHFGFHRSRSLWQMRRSLHEPLPDLTVPEGIRIRPFVVGSDETAWTALNNLAFANHPEQGRWTVRDVELREQEPWFDAAGFLLAERTDPTGPTNGELIAFHWTKVHERDVDGPPETRRTTDRRGVRRRRRARGSRSRARTGAHPGRAAPLAEPWAAHGPAVRRRGQQRRDPHLRAAAVSRGTARTCSTPADSGESGLVSSVLDRLPIEDVAKPRTVRMYEGTCGLRSIFLRSRITCTLRVPASAEVSASHAAPRSWSTDRMRPACSMSVCSRRNSCRGESSGVPVNGHGESGGVQTNATYGQRMATLGRGHEGRSSPAM